MIMNWCVCGQDPTSSCTLISPEALAASANRIFQSSATSSSRQTSPPSFDSFKSTFLYRVVLSRNIATAPSNISSSATSRQRGVSVSTCVGLCTSSEARGQTAQKMAYILILRSTALPVLSTCPLHTNSGCEKRGVY